MSRPTKRGDSAHRPPRRSGLSPLALATVVCFVIVGGLAVHPLQTWRNQKRQIAEAEAEAVAVEAEVAELQRQLDLLETNEEIERRARQDFFLVYPGEESYRLLPDAQQP